MAQRPHHNAMDPNVRWGGRGREEKKEQVSNFVRKADWPPGEARPAGAAARREANKHSHEPAKRRPIESEANGGQE